MEPTIAERAIAAGREERREKRSEALGLGKACLYLKLAASYRNIAPVLAKETPGQRGKYTSLDAVLHAVRAPLLASGILIRQGADRVFSMGDGPAKSFWTIVYTDLIDAETGEVQRTELPMPISRPDPQAVGAVMTYGRRYTLLAALGIASGDPAEDDDAQSAMPREIGDEDDADEIIRDIEATKSEADAKKLKAAYQKRIDNLNEDGFERVKTSFQRHVKALREASKPEPGATAKKTVPGPKNRIPATHEGGSA